MRGLASGRSIITHFIFGRMASEEIHDKIETKRLLLHPISDEEMQKIIDDEKNPEMQKAYSEMLQGCAECSDSCDELCTIP